MALPYISQDNKWTKYDAALKGVVILKYHVLKYLQCIEYHHIII